MSLPRNPLQPVPAETARVAHAAFPTGTVYMRIRDELGPLFDDECFTAVYAREGQPALHPWQLALVSVMQFAENLSDRQAAEAVRARIDWKYALGLDLTDEGFHYSALSEFRTRLIQGGIERVLLDRLLEQCRDRSWLTASGRQRTDSTHVVGAVKALNQLELVGETLRHLLNVLATVVPEWLKAHAKPEWFDRYAERIEDYRLPKDKTEREALSQAIGDDGYYLLDCIEQVSTQETRTGTQVWRGSRSCLRYTHSNRSGHSTTVDETTATRNVSRRRSVPRLATGSAPRMTQTYATAANGVSSGSVTRCI